MRRAIVALFFLFAFPGFADAGIPWHSVPATATAVARAQGKLLFIYYRAACQTCNAKSDAMMEALATDELFQRALESFLPLRVTDHATSHPITDEIAKLHKGPAIAIYDASGVQLAVFPRLQQGWSALAEDVLRFRAVREQVARAVELRLAGQTAAADYVIGQALSGTMQWRRAAERFDMAAEAYRARGDRESAQIAHVASGYAWYGAGAKARGRTQIDTVLRDPASDAAAAEAHLSMAAIAESEAHVTTTITTQSAPIRGRGAPVTPTLQQKVRSVDKKTLARAVESYRRAYALAPERSITLEAAKAALARLDDRPLPARAEAAATFRLIAPAKQVVTGEAEFAVEAGPNVARIEYYLDEAKVATETKAPFRAKLDVGATPRVRSVRARAFDGSGKAVGDSVVTINDRADAFLVTIVSPAEEQIAGEAEVEVDVRVPPSKTLKQIDVSWNDMPVATLTAPPFRAPLRGAEEFGYLRAVATLDDGTTSEATRVYNAGTVSETVEVGAVTVIASVTDRDGRRVPGLTASDFAVADEGQKVAPALRSADDEPVTIGIAIDTSLSMKGRQLYVIRAAAEFLRRALRPQDEAFVVAFDSGVQLVHPRTRDAEKLRATVLDLMPGGGTSLYDATIFALQQFQGIGGKKALVVFSDGREATSRATPKEAERLARIIGVPVYLIVPPQGERLGHALKNIAELTGGVMHHAVAEEELPALFDRIAEELRGQYVLSFERPAGVRAGTWRTIKVAVNRPNATVRTIQGYRAN